MAKKNLYFASVVVCTLYWLCFSVRRRQWLGQKETGREGTEGVGFIDQMHFHGIRRALYFKFETLETNLVQR